MSLRKLFVVAHSVAIMDRGTWANENGEYRSALRTLFVRYGLPQQIVSKENGPLFQSAVFENFLKQNSIQRVLVSLYHPSSNGQAERFVQTFKKSIPLGSQSRQPKALPIPLPSTSSPSTGLLSVSLHVTATKGESVVQDTTPVAETSARTEQTPSITDLLNIEYFRNEACY